MAPFAVCSNPQCDFIADLWADRRKKKKGPEPDPHAPCPICGWTKVTACESCHAAITEEGPDGSFTSCSLCGADVRRVPPPVVDRVADERENRLRGAVKCLDELIVIVMERIAVAHRIGAEDLASACQAESGDEDDS